MAGAPSISIVTPRHTFHIPRANSRLIMHYILKANENIFDKIHLREEILFKNYFPRQRKSKNKKQWLGIISISLPLNGKR